MNRTWQCGQCGSNISDHLADRILLECGICEKCSPRKHVISKSEVESARDLFLATVAKMPPVGQRTVEQQDEIDRLDLAACHIGLMYREQERKEAWKKQERAAKETRKKFKHVL